MSLPDDIFAPYTHLHSQQSYAIQLRDRRMTHYSSTRSTTFVT